MGRFFNVDVLAEDYDYQTPYAFSENKVTNHIELEGLEAVPIGPLGIPMPPPPPIYGSRTTGMHPVGRMVPEWFSKGVKNMETQNAQTTIAVTGIVLMGAMKVQDLVNSVLNSEGDNNHDKKSGNEAKSKTKAEERAEKLSQKQRPGKDFTKAGKDAVKDVNREKNNGKTVCENCGIETVPGKKSERGVAPPKNETQVDHVKRKREGGSGTPDNSQILCRGCNLDKH